MEEPSGFGFVHKHCIENAKDSWQAQNAFTPLFVGDHVKMGFHIPDSPADSKEYMWVIITKVPEPGSPAIFHGKLDNHPHFIPGLKSGALLEFTRDEIIDLQSWYRSLSALLEAAAPFMEHLECDGATRVLDYALTTREFPHRCMLGTAMLDGKIIQPHFWIEVDKYILDTKVRRWLGPEAQEGVIYQPTCKTEYVGWPVPLNTTEVMFCMLTNQMDTL